MQDLIERAKSVLEGNDRGPIVTHPPVWAEALEYLVCFY
jgi:hypothetical protein